MNSIVQRVTKNPALIRKAVEDPTLVGLTINQMKCQMRKGKEYNRDGTDIFADEDWDNLVILDACRYDMYESLTPFDGPVGRRESRGSSSDQWVYGNFHSKKCHDVVYISGNRWYLILQNNGKMDNELHSYHDIERDAFNGYVPDPETMTERALELAEEYPNKRLIIHYMQPHKPYLGKHSERFAFLKDEDYGLRDAVRAYDIDRETVISAYRSNLKLVLEHVEDLVEQIEGKTVISADHGELLGERLRPIPVRYYGHPERIYTEDLITVPWHVVSDGPRKPIESEQPETAPEIDEEAVEQTLRNLGYKV